MKIKKNEAAIYTLILFFFFFFCAIFGKPYASKGARTVPKDTIIS